MREGASALASVRLKNGPARKPPSSPPHAGGAQASTNAYAQGKAGTRIKRDGNTVADTV